MPYITGLVLGFSIIMVIGAQDIYVIKQGILRQYSFCCALVCGLCDALLIAVSVTGAYELMIRLPLFNTGLRITGIAFLLCYGGLSIKRGIIGKADPFNYPKLSSASVTLWKTIGIALGVSLLNPHAYIDNFVIIGGVATNLPPGALLLFALGAITASFIWFFVLVAVAIYFSPLLQKRRIWQGVEFLSGCLMLYIAIHILLSVLG